MALKPICIVCLSDCDAEGCMTSCNHFFCTRCLARQVSSGSELCPMCHKPYRLVKLSSPGLHSLFESPSQILGHSTKVVCNQLFHQQQIILRMREVLTLLNGRYQTAEKHFAACQVELRGTTEKLRVTEELARRQQQELDFLRHKRRSSSQGDHSRPSSKCASFVSPSMASEFHPPGASPHDGGKSNASSDDHSRASWVTQGSCRGGRQGPPPSPLSLVAARSAGPSPPHWKPPMPHEGGSSISPLGWSATSSLHKRLRPDDCSPYCGPTVGTANTSRKEHSVPLSASVGSRQSVTSHESPRSDCMYMTPKTCTAAIQSQSSRADNSGRASFRLSTPLVRVMNHTALAPPPEPLQKLLAGNRSR